MTLNTRTEFRNAFPLLAVLAAAMFAYWMSLAPRPVPAEAPPEAFSAERAYRHIALNCTEPQPAGSIRNDLACQYIQEELERMGVENELVLRYEKTGKRRVSRWRVVLGRLRGTDSTKAFAVDAHFDSVPWGPGAADDFSGIAAMLEAARALQAGPPLRNDVIFVFTDQEEFDMGGAKAFRDHPWFQEVGVMLGLEARGTSGPALMFETSPNNGFVVRQLARARVGARANSVMDDFYQRMPFNTDFSHYKQHVAGLNIAYINHFEHYHTMLDHPENVSLASLQHLGDYVLGLARHFGNLPLHDCYASNVAYFNTLGGHMVVYPLAWGWPLAMLAWTATLLVLGWGVSRRRIAFSRILLGLMGILIAMLVSSAIIGGISYLLYQRFTEAALYQSLRYVLAFHLGAFGILMLMVGVLRAWVRPQEFLASAVLGWALALVAVQVWAPGGAPLALLPLLFGCLCLWALLSVTSDRSPSVTAVRWSVVLVIPAIMIHAPLLVISANALTFLGAFMLVPTAVLLTGLILPPLAWMSRASLFKVAAASKLVAALLMIAGYVGTLPSPSSPRLHSLSYGVDFDQQQAWWFSGDRDLDEWTSQFIPEGTQRRRLPEFVEQDGQEYFVAPAPLPPFSRPVLEVRDDRLEGTRRILQCRLNSPRDAQRIWLQAVSGRVHSAEILGHELEGAKQHWQARFDLLPREGADLRLEVDAGTPLVFSVREQSFGLPELAVITPRPSHLIPEPNRRMDRSRAMHSDFTYSIATIDLGSGSASGLSSRSENTIPQGVPLESFSDRSGCLGFPPILMTAAGPHEEIP
ncbi:MAG: M20/M25/M40 family metallo-hydrolase [Planctomycetaceae bacterium]|nr:MAG: M20/M25/M40 family metallo-hydrolase [Planctomycetaceae bacterium]